MTPGSDTSKDTSVTGSDTTVTSTPITRANTIVSIAWRRARHQLARIASTAPGSRNRTERSDQATDEPGEPGVVADQRDCVLGERLGPPGGRERVAQGRRTEQRLEDGIGGNTLATTEHPEDPEPLVPPAVGEGARDDPAQVED